MPPQLDTRLQCVTDIVTVVILSKQHSIHLTDGEPFVNAYDFSINYFAGLLLLHGGDPYSNPLYRYPFPFTYFWALMALPGEQAMPLMFIIWGVINVGMLIYAFRKDFWKWIF